MADIGITTCTCGSTCMGHAYQPIDCRKVQEDDARARVAERSRLRAEAAARGRELPQSYRKEIAVQFAEGETEAKAIVDTYLTPQAETPRQTDDTRVEWGIKDDWYDDSEVQSYGVEGETSGAEDYARGDAARFGDKVTVWRRTVGPWEQA